MFVDELTCIGCRHCTHVCSKTFMMEEEHSRAHAVAQGVEPQERLLEAVDACPVNCIQFVTAPQVR